MMEAVAFQGLIGLSLAMYLWLISAGLTIIFGVLGIVNFAHGSLFMVGAYLAYTFYGQIGLPFPLAIVLSLIGTGLVGLVMERVLSRIYGIDEAYQLLLTFGFILILDDAVKMIWGGVFKIPPIPAFLDGALPVFGKSFPVYNIFVIAVGLIVALALWLAFEKTWWGRIVRATAADREMASAIGVNVPGMTTMGFDGCPLKHGTAIVGGLRSVSVTLPFSPRSTVRVTGESCCTSGQSPGSAGSGFGRASSVAAGSEGGAVVAAGGGVVVSGTTEGVSSLVPAVVQAVRAAMVMSIAATPGRIRRRTSLRMPLILGPMRIPPGRVRPRARACRGGRPPSRRSGRSTRARRGRASP